MHCRLWSIKGWKSLLSTQGKLLTLVLSHHLHSPPSTTLSLRALLLSTPLDSLSWHGLQHLLTPHWRVHQAASCMVACISWECLCFSPISLPTWISNQSKLHWSSLSLPVFKGFLQLRLDSLWRRTNISEESLYGNVLDFYHFNLYTESDVSFPKYKHLAMNLIDKYSRFTHCVWTPCPWNSCLSSIASSRHIVVAVPVCHFLVICTNCSLLCCAVYPVSLWDHSKDAKLPYICASLPSCRES